MKIRKDLLIGLTEEQIAKVRKCNNQDELLAAVSGGMCTSTPNEPCNSCGSWNVEWEKEMTNVSFHHQFRSIFKDCGAVWYYL